MGSSGKRPSASCARRAPNRVSGRAATDATHMLLHKSRAKNIAMAKSVASVVICEGCGERVAEIVADDGRTLCSRCHLTESRAKTPREEKPDPDQ